MCLRRAWLAAALLLLSLLTPDVTPASEGVIFVYHRFGEARLPSTNIPIATFAAQLDYLAQHKIPVLPLGDVVRRLRSGASLPERYVVLTVDDGYLSFASGAMPLLRRYGYPVTLFVSSASVGARGYLGWEELKRLQEEGVEIGNHSHRHPHLVNLWQQQGVEGVRGEIRRSQGLFREKLGRAPRLLAYPFGETVPEITAVVVEEGFLAAAVQHSGGVSERSDLMRLPRFAMGGPYATIDGFVEKSRMASLPVDPPAAGSDLLGAVNPPPLILALSPESPVEVAELNCFVAGERACRVEPLAGEGRRFRVVAEHPLTGRRNRYTLTARDRQGRWYWHSHLWIDPNSPE